MVILNWSGVIVFFNWRYDGWIGVVRYLYWIGMV